MNKVLLDTDIFSEIRKAIDGRVVSRAGAYRYVFGFYTISIMTVTEVVKGWQKRQREDRVQEFLTEIANVEVLPIDNSIGELAGRICGDLERIGQPIGLADSIIAATAIHQDLVLVTGNLSHYQRIQALGYSLKLDNWRS